MRLRYIKQETCECGGTTVGEEIGNRHSNGETREYRLFSCGGKLEYSPNFGKVIEKLICPKSKKYREYADTTALDSLMRSIDYCGDLLEEKKQLVRELVQSLYPEGVKWEKRAERSRYN